MAKRNIDSRLAKYTSTAAATNLAGASKFITGDYRVELGQIEVKESSAGEPYLSAECEIVSASNAETGIRSASRNMSGKAFKLYLERFIKGLSMAICGVKRSDTQPGEEEVQEMIEATLANEMAGTHFRVLATPQKNGATDDNGVPYVDLQFFALPSEDWEPEADGEAPRGKKAAAKPSRKPFVEDDEDEEEEEAPRGKKAAVKPSRKPVVVDDDEDEEEEEEEAPRGKKAAVKPSRKPVVVDDDEDEEEEEEEEAAPPKGLFTRKSKAAVKPAAKTSRKPVVEDDEDEEEEEEEAAPPKGLFTRKSKAAAKPAAKTSRKPVVEDDEDEEEEDEETPRKGKARPSFRKVK